MAPVDRLREGARRIPRFLRATRHGSEDETPDVGEADGDETFDEFVDRVYRQLLDRPVDPPGLAHWRSVVADGYPREQMVLDLAVSDEHVNRILREHFALPDLGALHPERFERQTRLDGVEETVFVARSDADVDWLEGEIRDHGYYDRPGIWSYVVDTDKRVLAELVHDLGVHRVLDLGCGNGVLMEAMLDLGMDPEGVELSSASVARAAARVRDRIHVRDVSEFDPQGTYDAVVGLDIFEHLNPRKIDKVLGAVSGILGDHGLLVTNIPVFGEDEVFGNPRPFLFQEWAESAAAGRWFRVMQVEATGFPLHGHLVWATPGWWTDKVRAHGFVRERGIEHAIQRRYRAYFDKASPGRAQMFVFSKGMRSSDATEVAAAYPSESEAVTGLGLDDVTGPRP